MKSRDRSRSRQNKQGQTVTAHVDGVPTKVKLSSISRSKWKTYSGRSPISEKEVHSIEMATVGDTAILRRHGKLIGTAPLDDLAVFATQYAAEIAKQQGTATST